jgi:hypothetical protein
MVLCLIPFGCTHYQNDILLWVINYRPYNWQSPPVALVVPHNTNYPTASYSNPDNTPAIYRLHNSSLPIAQLSYYCNSTIRHLLYTPIHGLYYIFITIPDLFAALIHSFPSLTWTLETPACPLVQLWHIDTLTAITPTCLIPQLWDAHSHSSDKLAPITLSSSLPQISHAHLPTEDLTFSTQTYPLLSSNKLSLTPLASSLWSPWPSSESGLTSKGETGFAGKKQVTVDFTSLGGVKLVSLVALDPALLDGVYLALLVGVTLVLPWASWLQWIRLCW